MKNLLLAPAGLTPISAGTQNIVPDPSGGTVAAFSQLSREEVQRLEAVWGKQGLKEFLSLSREHDAELCAEALLALAQRLVTRDKVSAAQLLFGFLSQSSSYSSVSSQAEVELAAIEGRGNIGRRLEFIGRRFAKQATEPGALLGMTAAMGLGSWVEGRLVTFLLNRPVANFFTRGIGAELVAKSGALLFETPAFVFASRGIHSLTSKYSPEIPLGEEMLATTLSLAGLKYFGLAGREAVQWARLRGVSAQWIPQASMLGGILMGYGLQRFWNLTAKKDADIVLTDSLLTLLHFNVGGKLSERLLGERGQQFFARRPVFNPRQKLGRLSLVHKIQSLVSKLEEGVRDLSLSPVMMAAGSGGEGSGRSNGDPPASEAITIPRSKGEDVRISPVPASQHPYLGLLVEGRYLIEDVLGEGGMGIVFRATHKLLGRQVAIKVLNAELSRDRSSMVRFLNEAKAASAIGNDHIIDVTDFGQLPDGATYLVMEYLNGVPLSKLVEGDQAVPVARILPIARQLGEGLAAAHHAGIVHRDLKPDNIFLIDRGPGKDFIKILDFGIAKVPDSGEKLTLAGSIFGTPDYMSPEQAAGSPADPRSDIYSLGVILYQMASGRVPFTAENLMSTLTQHMYKAPTPLRELVPPVQGVPPELEAIIFKCLAKNPDQRYPRMEDLITDLDKLNARLNPIPGSERPRPLRSRWPLATGLIGAGALSALVAALFVTRRKSVIVSTNPSADSAATLLPSETLAPVPPPTPVLTKKKIELRVEPKNAHIYQDDRDLGTNLAILELEADSSIEIEIRLKGFKTKKLKLDGSQDKLTIRLERQTTPLPGKPIAPVKPKKPKDPDDVVKPW